MAAWLCGNGCVPINNLMEDAATAEISRAQIWQWISHPGGVLADGRKVTAELFRSELRAELAGLQTTMGEAAFVAGKYSAAAALLDEIATARIRNFPDVSGLPRAGLIFERTLPTPESSPEPNEDEHAP